MTVGIFCSAQNSCAPMAKKRLIGTAITTAKKDFTCTSSALEIFKGFKKDEANRRQIFSRDLRYAKQESHAEIQNLKKQKTQRRVK